MDFPLRFKQLRKEKGVSQEEVAEHIGVSRVAISGYENEENPKMPKKERLERLANYFNCSTDYLLGKTDERFGKVTYTKTQLNLLDDIGVRPSLPMEEVLKNLMEKYDLVVEGKPATVEDVEYMIRQLQTYWGYLKDMEKKEGKE